MKPVDDNQMLQYIHKTGQMGQKSLGRVLQYPVSQALQKELREQQQEYKELAAMSGAMLRRRGQRPRNISRALDMAMHVHLKAEMLKDRSPAAVADMITHGNAMGLSKSIRHLNHYKGHNENIRTLAVRLMRTEKYGMDAMKPFL